MSRYVKKVGWHVREYRNHRDTGCEIAPLCLDCPLPLCKYDMPTRSQRRNERRRRLVIGRNRGMSTNELAIEHGVSARTVSRILADSRRALERAT